MKVYVVLIKERGSAFIAGAYRRWEDAKSLTDDIKNGDTIWDSDSIVRIVSEDLR